MLFNWPLPPHFPGKGQIERVGLIRNILFVALRNTRELELWSVHCLAPASWTCLFSYNFHELFYAHCALSSKQNAVFAMVAAFFETGSTIENGGIKILRYDLVSEKLCEFKLDSEYVDTFETVTLERVGIGCGQADDRLFLYDRTMVSGEIPFWRISLGWEQMTFCIKSMPILDEQQLCSRCIRFPVVLDGDKRIILRITDDFQVVVYDGNSEQWAMLRADENTELDLSTITVRGISETFGHNWHRFSAIESKLSIFADGDICVFKVLWDGKHHFYSFTVSLERKSYNLEHCSCASLAKPLETLCFVHCANGRLAFLNKHLVGFVFTQPPSLRELCFWTIQRQLADWCPRRKIWGKGKTQKEFQAMFNINQSIQIVD
ncbi:hypothetical protein GPALN_005449 [Globodera pallida]|nr:hypothetical protein GPALN_005449 [Globodera pallida]